MHGKRRTNTSQGAIIGVAQLIRLWSQVSVVRIARLWVSKGSRVVDRAARVNRTLRGSRPCPTGAIADPVTTQHTPLDRLSLSAEHAGCALTNGCRERNGAAALGACLAHAIHQAGYAASTLRVRSLVSRNLCTARRSSIAVSFCDEALCVRQCGKCRIRAAAGWTQSSGQMGCSSIQPIRMHVPPRRLLLARMAHA